MTGSAARSSADSDRVGNVIRGWALPRPSAALVLGAMAGGLAAASFLPTAIPLIWETIKSEETRGREVTRYAALAVQNRLDHSEPVGQDTVLVDYGVEALIVGVGTTDPVHLGNPIDLSLVESICASPARTEVVPGEGRDQWAVSCSERHDGAQVAAAVRVDLATQAQRVIALVLLLGLGVGIITALGILRLLRPLSEISGALARVGTGERGVRMSRTGLAELDELVDRLNAAARSVEDREDGILGRIEVVQEMARIVAHEIRNPLQSLELLTSLIASEAEDDERLEIAGSIHAEIRTLEQVVTRLLRESATRGSLRIRLTMQPVAPLVEQVIALRRPQANGQNVRLSQGPMTWAAAPFDQALVKRSVENLVLNALQAVPRNSGHVQVSVMEEDDWLVIVVDDNGPGVAPELQDHVFEANVTSKEGGTGLGLALVKGVVEAHSGFIRYGESPLGGARFEARIPRETDVSMSDVAALHKQERGA